MKTSFNQELESVQRDLLSMAALVQKTIKGAVEALKEQDTVLAREIINKDDVIDNYQITIEEKINRLWALEQPLATDLRLGTAIIKIASDLERIGDHATNISEIVLELKGHKYIKTLILIPRMAQIALNMLSVAIKALKEKNPELAEAVCRKDEQVDNLNREVYNKLVKIISESQDKEVANQAVKFIKVSQSLERVADHATNIGENVIYIATGRRVKY